MSESYYTPKLLARSDARRIIECKRGVRFEDMSTSATNLETMLFTFQPGAEATAPSRTKVSNSGHVAEWGRYAGVQHTDTGIEHLGARGDAGAGRGSGAGRGAARGASCAG